MDHAWEYVLCVIEDPERDIWQDVTEKITHRQPLPIARFQAWLKAVAPHPVLEEMESISAYYRKILRRSQGEETASYKYTGWGFEVDFNAETRAPSET